jgi:hypothetical protein
MTTMPREAIVQTGPLSGDDTANLAIGILHEDQGLYMVKASTGIRAGVQWRVGEVENTMGSACLMTTTTMTNTTMTTNTTTWRMGRGCTGKQTTGGNPTTMVAMSTQAVLWWHGA